MPTTMNRAAYLGLLNEDLDWLLRQPRTLERDHIEVMLRWCGRENSDKSALPPLLEDIQVCSIGIPDGYVPASQLDAVRERAKRCYNALAGVDDVEAFVAAAKELA